MNNTVLVIDDEEKLRKLIARIIQLEGYKVLEASNLTLAEKILAEKEVELVLCDVKLPDGNGVEFCGKIKQQYPLIEIILLTAYGHIEDGVQAMKNGAFDYIVKGNDNEKIVPLLSRANDKITLQRRVAGLEERLIKNYGFEKIIGTSDILKQAISSAEKVAPTDTAVLLNGETGTGKEVFAQSIHYHSKRVAAPFIAFNCSSFSKELLESELFGHKAGAFTGANKDRAGLIDEAKGGTLFLDEIGELPLELQPKLLRVLESGTYYRIGDSKQQTSNVRIIAATNRDLVKESGDGHFRSDLYYRIAVFTITLPSLRQRVEDIEPFARHFLKIYSGKLAKSIKEIDKEALTALEQCPWPGNIRELKNVIERAAIMEDSNALTIRSLPIELQHGITAARASGTTLASVEQMHILKVLKNTDGNKAEAARLLGIGIATLYRKLDEFRLKQELTK